MAALPRGFFFRAGCGSSRCWYLGGLRFRNIWCWRWSRSRFWYRLRRRGCGQYFPIVCVQNRGIPVRNAAGLFYYTGKPPNQSNKKCCNAVQHLQSLAVKFGQNAHSPFSKIVTSSPRFVMPVTWVSAAPTMTSSWMAELFRPFFIRSSRVMAEPPLMFVG